MAEFQVENSPLERMIYKRKKFLGIRIELDGTDALQLKNNSLTAPLGLEEGDGLTAPLWPLFWTGKVNLVIEELESVGRPIYLEGSDGRLTHVNP